MSTFNNRKLYIAQQYGQQYVKKCKNNVMMTHNCTDKIFNAVMKYLPHNSTDKTRTQKILSAVWQNTHQ